MNETCSVGTARFSKTLLFILYICTSILMYIFRNYVQAYVNIIYIIYCMFIYLSRYHLTLRLFMRLVLCMFFVPLAVFS